jgi:DNA-directed RNA polymerase subunit RPC12/RpoP
MPGAVQILRSAAEVRFRRPLLPDEELRLAARLRRVRPVQALHTSAGALEGVNCPTCSSGSIVLRKDGDIRRRRCTRCGQRFETVEKLQADEKRQADAIEALRLAARSLEPVA